MKKVISNILVVLVLFTFAVPAYGATSSYSDTKTSDWFYGSLDILSDEGIITGFPDGTYKPKNTLNVDQYITILCRLTDNDVGMASGYWATNYINHAKESGWLDGLNFPKYNVPINRYQASRLVVKALNYDSTKSPEELAEYKIYINDYDSIPTMYRTDVLLNYALGLTSGYPNGTFQGSNTLTRAEAAVISHRVFDEDIRKLLLDPAKTTELLALFSLDNLSQFALLEGELMMDLERMRMMFMLPPSMPALPAPPPVPITGLGLLPEVAVISENIIADALIELSDLESDNLIAAGYSYGILNLNLLSVDNESILIYSAEDGSNVVTLDLVLMSDEEGHIRADASDLILLVCNNIDLDNGQAMHDFIINQYNNRASILEEGSTDTFGTNDILITSLVHDHNVTKVRITTN